MCLARGHTIPCEFHLPKWDILIAPMDYARHGMLIRFVGTHKEYDEIEDIENI